MKNLFLTFISSLLFSITLSSCSDETIYDPVEEPGNFSFEISVPSSEMRTRADGTRAYGDGNTISELKGYVYDHNAEANSLPIQTVPVTLSRDAEGRRIGSMNLVLPSAGVYDFVFIATSCKQDDKNSKIYYNPEERSLNADYTKYEANDEGADCFFAVVESASVAKGSKYTVTLKRPMAQLNIGTGDLHDYNMMSTSPLEKVAVTVDGVYTAMDVMTGNVTGQPVKAVFPAALPPSAEFPAPDADYLSMSYLLMNERKDVKVAMTASNQGGQFITEFDDIPLQRNHQTVIHGNLLTAQNDFKVEINPAFAGQSDKDAEDPYADYDLVLEVVENAEQMPSYNDFALVFVTDGKSKTVSLTSYIDSNHRVKLSWEELGITEAEHMYFAEFFGCPNIVRFLNKCDINKLNVTNLSDFLSNSPYLENVDAIKSWDTSEITKMIGMFSGCSGLTELNLSNFNTENVTDMSNMFNRCEKLSAIDVTSFNTVNVTNMSRMFMYCEKISSLDLSSFNTENVTDMSGMFYRCENLASLDLSNFDTSNVNNMSEMFWQCEKMNTVNLSSFNTSKVTTMYGMFFNCYKLSSLDISNFNTSNVTSTSGMFTQCNLIPFIDVTKFDTRKVNDMSYMFKGCYNLQNIDVSTFDTGKVKNMREMFRGCRTLTSLDVTGFNTSNVTNMYYMFAECRNLNSLDLSGFNTSEVTSMAGMFEDCGSLTFLCVSNFDTSKVSEMNSMFQKCSGLSSLDVSSFNTSNVSSMDLMFNNCRSLTSLDVSGFNTGNVKNMSMMFDGCSGLTELDLSNFDTSNVTNLSYMFSRCIHLSFLDLSEFKTNKVTDMSSMFYYCEDLTTLNLSNFDTSNVRNMSEMFNTCVRLRFLDLSNFNTSNVSNMKGMFAYCYALISLDLSSFDISKADTTDMFLQCSAEVFWGE